mgnify:CR=1 FL=1
MNLYFRLLLTWLRARFFSEPIALGNTIEMNLRVWPTDLDVNGHMNNGRYLTICDLNRVDIFARSGLLKAMFKRNWLPVIAEHTMTYKKPLGIFVNFKVKTEVTHWDEKYFYMKHVFTKDERIMAEGTSKGCVYARGIGVVSPDEAITAVEQDKLK